MSGFLIDQFREATFVARTATVDLPSLKDFFPEGTAPAFLVRALTAIEVQKSNDAAARQGALDGVVRAIASQKDQVDAIRKSLGMTQDAPGELVKRMEMLVHGSVDPKLNHADVVKLSTSFPVEFYELTNRITQLTGQGADRVKP